MMTSNDDDIEADAHGVRRLEPSFDPGRGQNIHYVSQTKEANTRLTRSNVTHKSSVSYKHDDDNIDNDYGLSSFHDV